MNSNLFSMNIPPKYKYSILQKAIVREELTIDPTKPCLRVDIQLMHITTTDILSPHELRRILVNRLPQHTTALAFVRDITPFIGKACELRCTESGYELIPFLSLQNIL